MCLLTKHVSEEKYFLCNCTPSRSLFLFRNSLTSFPRITRPANMAELKVLAGRSRIASTCRSVRAAVGMATPSCAPMRTVNFRFLGFRLRWPEPACVVKRGAQCPGRATVPRSTPNGTTGPVRFVNETGPVPPACPSPPPPPPTPRQVYMHPLAKYTYKYTRARGRHTRGAALALCDRLRAPGATAQLGLSAREVALAVGPCPTGHSTSRPWPRATAGSEPGADAPAAFRSAIAATWTTGPCERQRPRLTLQSAPNRCPKPGWPTRPARSGRGSKANDAGTQWSTPHSARRTRRPLAAHCCAASAPRRRWPLGELGKPQRTAGPRPRPRARSAARPRARVGQAGRACLHSEGRGGPSGLKHRSARVGHLLGYRGYRVGRREPAPRSLQGVPAAARGRSERSATPLQAPLAPPVRKGWALSLPKRCGGCPLPPPTPTPHSPSNSPYSQSPWWAGNGRPSKLVSEIASSANAKVMPVFGDL